MSVAGLLAEGLIRPALTEAAPLADDLALADLAARVEAGARKRLGRSLSIRQVDAGSCNGCELEIHALANAFYDLESFGLRFVASPRHADVLLVTGPVTRNMREALERTWAATPGPKWVVAAGACALDGLRDWRRLCPPRRHPHPRLPPDPHGFAQGPAGAAGGRRTALAAPARLCYRAAMTSAWTKRINRPA
jgi:hypothetical protein